MRRRRVDGIVETPGRGPSFNVGAANSLSEHEQTRKRLEILNYRRYFIAYTNLNLPRQIFISLGIGSEYISFMPARRPNRKSLPSASVDVVCFCHLRWDFVYQRPQHLMSRFAKTGRVFYIEEPVISEGGARFETTARDGGVTVVVPHVPREKTATMAGVLRPLIDRMFRGRRPDRAHYLWIYTPMAVEWTRHLRPRAVIYDCMDELSAFKGAPPGLKQNEKELLAWLTSFSRAAAAFSKPSAISILPYIRFPSSVDVAHFASARSLRTEPDDQARIPGPRLGYFGVIDERMDLKLLARVADARPDWHS